MNLPLLKRVSTSVIAGVTAAALVLSVGYLALRSEQRRHLEELRAETVTVASRVRADIEKALEQRIFVVEGLAGFAVADLAADGQVDGDQFERYAATLDAESDVPLRSLQLAPAGVVTYVYPVEGNEAALGHDLLEDPARAAAVMEAVRLRKPMVAGPFELLQGGEAIVVRKPVFESTPDSGDEWWGLATMVADIAPLYAQVGIDGSDPSLDAYDIALRGRDQSGATGEAFFGDDAVFGSEGAPVTFEVTLPAGSWQLGMLPAGGWDAWPWTRTTEYELSVLALALALGWLTWRYAASRADARRSANDLGQLLETANAPIAEFRSDGTVLQWNREMGELLGVEAEDVLGTVALADPPVGPLKDAVSAATYAEFLGILAGASGDAEAAAVELAVERADGSVTPVLVNVATKSDGRGSVDAVVLVCQDLSARLEAEVIKNENEAIARTARLKDEFLASMSHELRTPLNGIIGLSSILDKETFGPLNDKQHEYVSQIATSGRHLLALINDVLDLAKIEAQEQELDLASVDLATLAREAANVVREGARAKGLSLKVDTPNEPATIVGDARRLKQVALNLLSNAVKFTPSGGTVTLSVVPLGDQVRFEVADTGIGVPEDKQHLLFEPFQQVDSALNRTYEGTGLGLALTAKLVELHGGTIEVESVPGQGSRFWVTLPTGRDRPMGDLGEAAPTVDDAVPTRPQRTDGRIVVVLAEDNELNRQMLTDVLQAADVEVIAAEDGVEAVDLTRERQPDVVLMDIQMPRRDGLEATRMLKADAVTSDIPIVAITALAMNGDAERCLEAGCDAYLSKPIEPDQVVALVRQFARATATS